MSDTTTKPEAKPAKAKAEKPEPTPREKALNAERKQAAAAEKLAAEILKAQEKGTPADKLPQPSSWDEAVAVVKHLTPGLAGKNAMRKAMHRWPQLYDDAGQPKLR